VNQLNARRLSPLHAAIETGHLDVARYLCCATEGKGANAFVEAIPDGRGNYSNTALQHACVSSAGATSSTDYERKLRKKELLDFIKLLVTERKCKVAYIDGDGMNALHFAALGGNRDVCKYLIEECGLDARTKDSTGRSVLAMACFKGDTSTVGYLLTTGAVRDINALDFEAQTPLKIVCRHSATKRAGGMVAKLLLQFGALIDTRVQTQGLQRASAEVRIVLTMCCACFKERGTSRCSGCQRRLYCGKTCFAADWPKHKQYCKLYRADEEKKAAAAASKHALKNKKNKKNKHK
jgi:ankyrin repeat protein